MEGKKIGILTFHRATNYGAILQAFGLLSYLEDLGHDVKIIDYKPDSMARLFSVYPIKIITIKGLLVSLYINYKRLTELPVKIAKRRMFWNYIRKLFPMTTKIENEKDLPEFDVIIVGSDQVWSTCFTGGVDKFFFGQFDRKGAKLISYAGSAAEDMEGSFYSTNNEKLLESFDAISVREDELQKYLQSQLPHKEISKVLDPTLLAGRECFDKLIDNAKPLEYPYILIYQVIRNQNSLIQNLAQLKAKELGCSIVEIKDSKMFINNGDGYKNKGMVNPSMFVALHKYAQYIITTSFHGTAFSILFNRPFNVVSISPKIDSRAKDLLYKVGLDDRLLNLPNEYNQQSINWDQVNKNIENLRIPSRNFLTTCL